VWHVSVLSSTQSYVGVLVNPRITVAVSELLTGIAVVLTMVFQLLEYVVNFLCVAQLSLFCVCTMPISDECTLTNTTVV